MVRGKVKHQFIENNTIRRASYRKRMKGFKKMLSELTTLCGVMACAITYGPNAQAPEIWPNEDEARKALTRFQNCSPEEKARNVLTHEVIVKKRIEELKKQLQKQIEENRRIELTNLMYKFMKEGPDALRGISYQDSIDFEAFLDERRLLIQKKMEILKNSN
ncbi:hypothetical protein AQUCO_01200123v1 [Aquilegia coerulea]|uniref:MADS-box domain-containing protein n=1 Tax=Aquilegia coerulea TaxID=218851 RepID=A0A2G5E4G9_AQUCA|nr:hypothetical protein AQUCO_01200123v1 [Aquilegia coerulea]